MPRPKRWYKKTVTKQIVIKNGKYTSKEKVVENGKVLVNRTRSARVSPGRILRYNYPFQPVFGGFRKRSRISNVAIGSK